VQHALPVQTWHPLKPSGGGHALFNSRRYTQPPEVSVLIRLLTDAPTPKPPTASAVSDAPQPSVAGPSEEPLLKGGVAESDEVPSSHSAVLDSAAPPALAMGASHGGTQVFGRTCERAHVRFSEPQDEASSLDASADSGAGPLFLSQEQRAQVQASGVAAAEGGGPEVGGAKEEDDEAAVADEEGAEEEPRVLEEGRGGEESVKLREATAPVLLNREHEAQVEAVESAGGEADHLEGREAACAAAGDQEAEAATVAAASHPTQEPAPSPPSSHCELVVQFRMPPPAALAALLDVSPAAAAAVVPRLRWLGREVPSLPGAHSSWQLSAQLSGSLAAVLSTLAHDAPLLSLHLPAHALHAAPLALASLPVGLLRPTRDGGAALDETIELFASATDDSSPSVRLGVSMLLRERDAATLQQRDTDPRVAFVVRVRLVSLTLLKAPPAERAPVSYTGGAFAEQAARWCAVRLSAYAGCAAQASAPVECVAGHPSSLEAEELSVALPNPPFTPRAALQRLREAPLAMELLCARTAGALGGAEPHLYARASVCLEDICGGALLPLAGGPGTPAAQVAAATAAVARSVEFVDTSGGGAEPVARVQLELTLQCVYTSEAPTPQDHRPARTLSPQGPAASPHAQLVYRFAIAVRSARDLALPLGGYANVYCRFHYRMLESTDTGAASKPVRSSPVLLPKHGEVALPNGGCVFELSCAPPSLLATLSHEPLLVELWHKDRYAADVLLGLASVDLAEVLGVMPKPSGTSEAGFERTERVQELVVPVRSPKHAPLALADPNASRPSSSQGSKASSSTRVALLRVGLRLEELGPSGGGPSAALGGLGRGVTRAEPAAPPAGAAQGPAEAALLQWRGREEARWRSALKRREEELLATLSREWAKREAARDGALGGQRRVLGAVEAELKGRLAEVAETQRSLRAAEAELAARSAAVEQKAAYDAAALQSAALREQTRLQGEVGASQAALAQSQTKVAMLEERLVSADAREARHDEQAVALRDATAGSAARALALQAEVSRQGALLHELRATYAAAVASAEQRKQQALSAHRELQRLQAEVQAREEARLREALLVERHAHEQMTLHAQADHEAAALASEASELQRLKIQLAQLEAHAQPSRGGAPVGAAPLRTQPPTRVPYGAPGRGVGALFSCAAVAPAEAAAEAADPTEAEVARLQGMCDDFVRSGMYSQGDRVLLLLRERIGQLTGRDA